MNHHKLLALLTLAAAAAMSGCTTMSKSYPLHTPSVEILPLHRSEYMILGDTEGQACARYFFGGKLPWFSGIPSKTVNTPGATSGFLASLPIIGAFFGGQEAVINEALYEAIDKVPSADSVMSVRVSMHKRYAIPMFYKDECATVKGKAFRLKVDRPKKDE